MTTRRLLEFQANRIEAVLSLHKVPARVTGGTVTPRWVRFQALPAVGTRISRINGQRWLLYRVPNDISADGLERLRLSLRDMIVDLQQVDHQ